MLPSVKSATLFIRTKDAWWCMVDFTELSQLYQELSRGQYFNYTGGYIAKKVQRIVCPAWKEILTGRQERTVRETLLSVKQVPHAHHRLVVVTPHLLTLVEDIQIIFRNLYSYSTWTE